MARFLIACTPFTGHATPLSAIARELVLRGHDVRCYSGAPLADRFAAAGARFVPWSAAPDFDEHDLAATFPRLAGKKGIAQLLVNMEDLFIGTAPGQVRDLAAEWEREPWDALVAEEVSIGPRLVADALGCRWAVRRGFDRVWPDPRYRLAAEHLAGQLAAAGGVAAAVGHLERFVL